MPKMNVMSATKTPRVHLRLDIGPLSAYCLFDGFPVRDRQQPADTRGRFLHQPPDRRPRELHVQDKSTGRPVTIVSVLYNIDVTFWPNFYDFL